MGRRDWTAPPGDLDGQSKAFWRHTRSELQAQGTWKDSDAPLLERYVRQVERARQARKNIPEDGTTRGSQGQLVEHPAIKTVREAERDAHKYATDLLLTPASRKAQAGSSLDDEFADILGG